MDKLARFVESLLGIGIVSTLAILVVLYVVRGAVAKAVELVGQKELERLKTELSKDLEEKKNAFAQDLEEKKNAFARDLDRERHAAARELETFKAELSLPAEVRRQVAARKVDAAEKIMKLGEPLARALRAAPKAEDTEAFAPTMTLLNDYGVLVREVAHYFDEEVAEQLYAYSGKLFDAKVKWDANPAVRYFEAASAAHRELLDLIRGELGLRPRSSRE